MLAYGKLNRDMMSNGYVGCKLGFEFSGLLNNRRIMGVAKQAIATHVFARDYLVSPRFCYGSEHCSACQGCTRSYRVVLAVDFYGSLPYMCLPRTTS